VRRQTQTVRRTTTYVQRFHDTPTDAKEATPREPQRGWRGTLVASGATLVLIAASPALALATGDGTWYALPLFVGLIAFWRRGHLTLRQMGFRSARGFYRPATIHPLLVVGASVALATALSAMRVREVGFWSLTFQVSTLMIVSFVGSLMAEDGFFRGALWGALKRAGHSSDSVLLWTSAASTLWFLPLLFLEPGLGAAPETIGVHLLNVWLLALCWGILRLASGSVLAAAWGHGIWSGLTYTLYGFGPAAGALNVLDPVRFDPERGWLGVALNATAFLILWRWLGRAREAQVPDLSTEDPAPDTRSG